MADKKVPFTLRHGLLVAVVLAFVGVTGWMQFRHAEQSATPGEPVALPDVAIGGPFTLVDHTGRQVSDADYRGSYMLVFFGYTYCPDVCPTELATIADALDQLTPAEAAHIRPLFVSVDPERDTPESLAEFVAMFHPSLIGLTGSRTQVDAAVKAYRAFYRKVDHEGTPAPQAKADYLIDHSAVAYLMGPDGKFLTTFSYGTTPEKMAATLRSRLGDAGAGARIN